MPQHSSEQAQLSVYVDSASEGSQSLTVNVPIMSSLCLSAACEAVSSGAVRSRLFSSRKCRESGVRAETLQQRAPRLLNCRTCASCGGCCGAMPPMTGYVVCVHKGEACFLPMGMDGRLMSTALSFNQRRRSLHVSSRMASAQFRNLYTIDLGRRCHRLMGLQTERVPRKCNFLRPAPRQLPSGPTMRP